MDSNTTLQDLYNQFHIYCTDIPTPEEAKTVLGLYKMALAIKKITYPDFIEILFDPLGMRYSIIARREYETAVTDPLLTIIRKRSMDEGTFVEGEIFALDDYKESFLPQPFLKWPAQSVYVGLREDEQGDGFSSLSILSHFDISNAEFKDYLIKSIGCDLQIGTSWDCKLLYVGGPDDDSVNLVLQVFHELRIDMIQDVIFTQGILQVEWDTAQERAKERGIDAWAGRLLREADNSTVSGPSEAEMSRIWDKKEEEEDLLVLD